MATPMGDLIFKKMEKFKTEQKAKKKERTRESNPIA
jgi:hypothetical protein